MRVAFIGLGNMGQAMARNLVRAGHALTVFNRTRSRADTLASEGAGVAGSPAEAARNAEAVITMLSDDHAVSEVMLGSGSGEGVLRAMPAGAVHVSMSTISPALSRTFGERHLEAGQSYVAAPVFGRPEVAAAGSSRHRRGYGRNRPAIFQRRGRRAGHSHAM
jgi:3-hydroxyisobutyrate dehydrogenase-like beta-hydroxyacid dehydrogenase